jgi:threonine synthase
MTLTCFLCGKGYPADRLINTCECGRPLRVDYDLASMRFEKKDLVGREATLWRYREVLPDCPPISLGEGMTPLHRTPRLGANWWVKDEGVNPTSSFKARGMAVAVSMAKHLGATKLAVPTAGNAGGAMAAYAAKAGLEAHVFMPRDTPSACVIECRNLGADVRLIDGLITDCAAEIGRIKEQEGWFDLSTLKEPYRVEGKKTMGYEIAEQMDWTLPDAIIYPTGGGTGLVGMWKAFDEMERLGWIDSKRPKMISVQADGCAPIATAFAAGERFATEFPNAHTAASGLRVPRAIGDFIMLDLIRASRGTAITVSDSLMIEAAKDMSSKTGIFAAPEGGATLAAARRLLASGLITEEDTVVLFNTGSGVKYLEALG